MWFEAPGFRLLGVEAVVECVGQRASLSRPQLNSTRAATEWGLEVR